MSIETRARQYGTVVGDWKFDGRIGIGSSGTEVFRLKRLHFKWHENSALKVVPVIEESGKWEYLSDFFKNDYEKRKQELCKKAEEEVRIMYKIHGSAYVVNYLYSTFYNWKDGNSFGCDMLIRMELLENLREEMKCRTTYTEKEIIKIGKDICKALICCHKENIIHRDIKPENIFRNKQGDYKLGDFGISRIVSYSQFATTMIGTPAYAAPEQFAQNSADNYDYRVDIYSLSLVLYELCNQNRLPFAKSSYYINDEEKLLRIKGTSLEKPCNASKQLSEVILKACAYKPENRYQSAQEFLDALITVDNSENSVKDENNLDVTKLAEESSDLSGIKSAENLSDLYVTKSAEESSDLYRTKSAENLSDLYVTKSAKASSDLYETKPAEKSFDLKDKTQNQQEKSLMSLEELYQIGTKYYKEKNYVEAVKWYRKSAEQGNAEAQYILGDCYYYGIGVNEDYQEAVKWYRKSAEQRNAGAQHRLGYCYYYGHGVKKDYQEAIKWYRKSAEQGDVDAQYFLGDYYYELKYGIKDYQEAVKWYRKSAEQGNAEAQYMLGNCYYNGYGVEKDYKEAVKWYRESAEQGNTEAQYMLGDCYYKGYGVEKDYKEAVKWYRESAEQGNAEAQYSLGYCYHCGRGVRKDYQEAVKWYKKSAEQGNATGQYYLGHCYYYEKIYGVAIEWLEKSAKQGNEYAQYLLGDCYCCGHGLEKDYKEAVKWYKKSAEQGNADAQYRLGDCYYYGIGVNEDKKEAVKWYKKSAEQGNVDAQYSLGDCYYYGIGVNEDKKEAVKWLKKSAEQGNNDAKNLLKKMGF